MADRSAITAEYIRSILHYDPNTGVFRWRERPRSQFKTQRSCSIFNARDAGKIAGGLIGGGYWRITVDGNHYCAHRLAWLIATGSWPFDEIDHIDRNPANNALSNLREASRSQNCANVRIRKDNSSTAKGVHWCKRDRKWIARLQHNNTRRILGYFSSREDADQAYCSASIAAFGEFSASL